MTAIPATDRRAELLAIAARLFAERGLRATTVRDIADAAGILSG
ncbi:MAG: transcriptional regulator, TetR family, partial [Jatrophihabitans sp.]|nr:transcriptional regulator, TetR family [Jatrophihabitans sp.]